jgi:hypothetical protein
MDGLDLIAFMRDRLHEVEEAARHAHDNPPPKTAPSKAVRGPVHIAAHARDMYVAVVSPAVTLADIAAKRAILDEAQAALTTTDSARAQAFMWVVRALAHLHAGHWAYKPQWAL